MPEYGIYKCIENYVYLYHTDTFIVIPSFPDSISDSLQASFSQTTPMARSAPIYSYNGSGPRSLQVNLKLHRDMMTQINKGTSNIPVDIGDDYVDTLIKQIQAVALPSYGASQKMVDPPLVAVRFGEDIFIKGVVNGAVSVTYELPLLDNGKYALVEVSFTVNEVNPYDAEQVMAAGSYRGLDQSLERRLYQRV